MKKEPSLDGSFLNDFLLQIGKQRRIKKFTDGDLQSVADLFQGGNGGALVATACNIGKGGLGNAT